MSDKSDFTITFSPELSPEDVKAVLTALSDYYRACGGIGFQVEFEPKPGIAETKPRRSLSRAVTPGTRLWRSWRLRNRRLLAVPLLTIYAATAGRQDRGEPDEGQMIRLTYKDLIAEVSA